MAATPKPVRRKNAKLVLQERKIRTEAGFKRPSKEKIRMHNKEMKSLGVSKGFRSSAKKMHPK